MRISSLVTSFALALFAVGTSVQAQTTPNTAPSGGGTPGTIPIWKSSSALGNSIITQAGSSMVHIGGSVILDGGLTGITSSGYGVLGESTSGIGVSGHSVTSPGVSGVSTSDAGVSGGSSNGAGVLGVSDTSYGIYGISTSGVGVRGIGHDNIGVSGTSTSDAGVSGSSTSNVGVLGVSVTLHGVVGTSTDGIGVYGESATSNGISGKTAGKYAAVVGENTGNVGDGVGGIACNSCSGPVAVIGIGGLAGHFVGKTQVVGDFVVSGTKSFHIDHPLDPANKYLNHFAVESNEVLDTYSGNVTTDEVGTASVKLPDYFKALNTNYRYQLTVIGQFAQAIVLQEIENNRFVIKTDKPSVKVSWQVTGVRSDAYIKAHAMPVEEDKPEQERGYYLTPEVFGQPEEQSISWLYHSDLMRKSKELEQQRQVHAATARLQKQSAEGSGQ
jgi:hypothetical protein